MSPLGSVIPSQQGPTWKPHSGGAGAGGGSGGDCSGAGTCGRSGLERWVNSGWPGNELLHGNLRALADISPSQYAMAPLLSMHLKDFGRNSMWFQL